MRLIICFLSLYFLSSGCKKDGADMEPDNTLNKQLIYGTWKPVPDQMDYRSRKFGTDSAYIVDGGNWGFPLWNNKWWWGNVDTIHLTFGGAVHWQKVIKLTNDSLVVYYSQSPSEKYRYFRE